MMKFLVTGALGHIGSRLIRHLSDSFPGSKIVMVDNMLTQRYCSLFGLPRDGSYEFIEDDVAINDLSPHLVGVDCVVHLAAMTDAAASVNCAEQVEKNNLAATSLVANACAAAGVPLITLSSTSVYGTDRASVDEDCGPAHLNPSSPYAKTKLKEEGIIEDLIRNQGLRACILRFGTIFGVSPGMRFHTAVNKFCWQAAMQLPITVWSTAYDQKRPYLDLHDACRCIEHIIRHQIHDGRIYNVLTLNATVRQVVEVVRQIKPTANVEMIDNSIMNNHSFEVSIARLASTGFHPIGNLKETIKQEIELIDVNQ
jgi:UDP-glucose 4-epimerase